MKATRNEGVLARSKRIRAISGGTEVFLAAPRQLQRLLERVAASDPGAQHSLARNSLETAWPALLLPCFHRILGLFYANVTLSPPISLTFMLCPQPHALPVRPVPARQKPRWLLTLLLAPRAPLVARAVARQHRGAFHVRGRQSGKFLGATHDGHVPLGSKRWSMGLRPFERL